MIRFLKSSDNQFDINRIQLVCWFLLVASVLNPVLRVTIDNPVTLFRILSPLVVLVFVWHFRAAISVWYGFLLFITYNLFILLSSDFSLKDTLLYLIHYFYLFSCFYLVRMLFHIRSTKENIVLSFNRFVLVMIWFIYILYFLKDSFGISIFYDFDFAYYNSTVFRSVNDLGAVIAVTSLFLLGRRNIPIWHRLLILMIGFYINYENDSKASILGTLLGLGVGVIVYLRYFLSKFRVLQALTGLAVAGGVVYLMTVPIGFPDGPIRIYDFFVEPIERVMAYKPFVLEGSIYDRTDSAIYAVNALIESYVVGLGAGSSIRVLELTPYTTITAKSLHNGLLEWLVDFGWLAVMLFGLATFYVIKELLRPPTEQDFSFSLIGVSLPILLLSQSSGFVSNFAFWIIVFVAVQFRFWSDPMVNFKSAS